MSEARDWEEIASRPEFQVLRHRLRSFVFPMTGLFLGWYLLYVLLASYAPAFMAIKLFGNINVGLVFGLLQFVSTFLITFLYVRFADRKLDPLAAQLRDDIETGRRTEGEGSSDVCLAAGVEGSNPILNLTIFGLFVIVTLAIVIRVSKRASSGASDFYTAGGGFSGPQNGVAISGDYLSAASFLGIAGAIAINGYDGFLYSVGFLVAWLVALLLVAELLRNTGKYTMGDVLAFRMRQRPVRAAAATSTLAVSFFYLLAQMAGAGGLVALLLNVTSKAGQAVVIAIVGAVMIAYVLIGGMRGTTWVQIIKAVLLIAGAGIMTIWVLALYGFSLSAVLGDAVARAGATRREAARAGRAVRQERASPGIDFISLGPGPRARHRGPAAHPHALLHRADGQGGPPLGGLGDLPDRPVLPVHAGPRVRRGRAGRPGRDQEGARRRQLRGPAAGLPARRHDPARHHRRGRLRDDPRGGGRPDDHRVGVVRPRHLRQRDQARQVVEDAAHLEVKIARRTAIVIGIVAILGGILANGQNIAFLVALAFAVAASANLPTILYSLFWKRFNTTGALCSIYGGLGITLILIIFSPVVSGKPVDPVTGRSTSMLQGVDFHWFPLDNPGLVSIPLSFLLGYLGTVLGKDAAGPGQGRRDGGQVADRRGRGEGARALIRLPLSSPLPGRARPAHRRAGRAVRCRP